MLMKKIPAIFLTLFLVTFASFASAQKALFPVDWQLTQTERNSPYPFRALVGVRLSGVLPEQGFFGDAVVELVSPSEKVIAKIVVTGRFERNNTYVGGLLEGACATRLAGTTARLILGAERSVAPLSSKPKVSLLPGWVESTESTRVDVRATPSVSDRVYVVAFRDRTRTGGVRGAIDVRTAKGDRSGSNYLLGGDWSREGFSVTQFDALSLKCG